MPLSGDVIKGALVITDLPDGQCFESFEALLRALPTFLGIQLPTSITNVIISNIQPSDDQRNSLWIRQSNDGGVLGIYVFAAGAWRQLTPVPQGVFWMYGNSTQVPTGYILVDDDNPHFTSLEVDAIQLQFVRDPTDSFFTYFAVTFEGF